MKFGLTSGEIALIEAIFRKEIPITLDTRVYIFGSRSAGRYQKYSDVDLLVESEALPLGILSLIADRLEESTLPYKFDLVDARKLAPEYAQSIHNSKQLLFSL